MDAWASWAYGFALVLFRTTALVTSAPFFGMRNAPTEVRLALSLMLAQIAYFGAGAPVVALPTHLGVLLLQVFLETLMGLFAGTAVRFGLEAAAIAGQLTAQTMGLGFGATLDPLSGTESNTVGELFRLLALGGALALGLDREIITSLTTSVIHVPPGTVESVSALARGAIDQAIAAIILGVRLGFPFLAAITLGHITLGLLGRAAQQLHFSNVGFSVSILFGGGALWIAAPYAISLCAEASFRFLPGR